MTEFLNSSKSNNSNFNIEHFFELSADLFCIAGFDGYFKKINAAVSELLGYTQEELFSKPINEFIFPDDREITSQHRYQLTENNPLFNFENRYVTKSGDIVWLHWTSMPVQSEQLVYAIAKNITHKKKLEEHRNSHLAKLTRINEDIRQLSYTTSHDLRSPVNNLFSVLELIDMSKIEDEETLELLSMINAISENLKSTLNSSLDGLVQRDNVNSNIEELVFKDSLDKVLRSINSLVEKSKTVLNIDFSKAEKIKFNKAYLESIFLNLITNAIKYARPDRYAEISIYSEIRNGTTRLIVSDNGMGFDLEKVKDKIFGFHQKFHNHEDSHGIGLYLVYNHIKSLGGNISVESKVNEGAKFIIEFTG